MSQASRIRYIDVCPPLLLVVFPDCRLEDAEWIGFFDRVTEYRKRWGTVIMLSDAAGTKHLPTTTQRAMIADHLTKQDRLPTDETTFVVMTSTVYRGVATALSWLSPGKKRDRVFGKDLEEVLDKALAYAQERGIQVTGDPTALLRMRAAS